MNKYSTELRIAFVGALILIAGFFITGTAQMSFILGGGAVILAAAYFAAVDRIPQATPVRVRWQ